MGVMLYQTRQGVFGPAANGGGIFNNALGATLQKGIVPSSVSPESAATQKCVADSCKDLHLPEQVAACISACAAKSKAASSQPASTSSVPKTSAGPTSTAVYTAQTAMYQPAGQTTKLAAIALGAVAAAGFVYLYVTKKKKGHGS